MVTRREYPPAKTEKNKRTCVVCGDTFYEKPCKDTASCKKKKCRFVVRSAALSKHGMAGTRLYAIWADMKRRCKPDGLYEHLDVCSAWQKFESFHDWAFASGYSDKLEIDRKDNELGYSPENCRWATRSQQNQNTRSRKGSASQYKGVFPDSRPLSKPWRSKIEVSKKQIHLGYFTTEEDAARAYDAAAKEAYGEFACLNFKDDEL